MDLVSRLTAELASYDSVLVGYSGGVDSALVAVAARQALGRDGVVAGLGISPSVSTVQRDQARAIAAQFDITLVEVETNEFMDSDYVANRTDRCYFCKRELWSRLADEATRLRMAVMADGTNADDSGDHRPGERAGREHAVRSPLADLGFTKVDVRTAARALRIPIWDAPAAPCLSSRLLYGLEVTPVRVGQVEAGEAILRRFGVEGDMRVRHRGDEARIEVASSQQEIVRRHRDTIGGELLDLGFARVTLDLAGYRRGSLLDESAPAVELVAERT